MIFPDDKAALEFLDRLLKSEFWVKMNEHFSEREKTIFTLLKDPKLSANGRAMINGRLVEIKYFQDFPVNALAHLKWQQEMAKMDDEQKKEALLSKPAFPDVVTH